MESPLSALSGARQALAAGGFATVLALLAWPGARPAQAASTDTAPAETSAAAADGRNVSPMEALGELLGAMSGKPGQNRAPIDREKLRERMPDSVAGERRTRIKSGVNEMLGFSGAYAEADYGSGDRKMTVKLTDMGAIGAMSVSVGQISDEETDSRIERAWREEGRYLQLKADSQAKTVDYSVHFASGVVLEIDARGFTVDEVKAAVTAIDPKRIEALVAPTTTTVR